VSGGTLTFSFIIKFIANLFLFFSAYEFAQTIEELENCKQFPPIESFANTLTGEGISPDDYNLSKKIFVYFRFKNMREYMEAYCEIDVYLLAEVFTEFRAATLQHFGIDPNYFVSLPGLGLECFLKKTGIELDGVYSSK